MKNVFLYTNFSKPMAAEITHTIVELLQQEKINIYMLKDNDRVKFDGVIYESMQAICATCDLAVVLGGDGTMLSVSSKLAPQSIPILGINLGKLGFLAEVEHHEIKESFKFLFDGKYKISDRMMLSCGFYSDNTRKKISYALNDIVISRGTGSRLINIQVFIDNAFAGEYIADGLIISTPTGSTAYSLSAGGPIVDPSVNVFIISPICPHTLSARPLIVPSSKRITLKLGDTYRKNAVASIDGRDVFHLADRDWIVIGKARYHTKLIELNNKNFYDILRQKLTERGDRR